MKSTTAIIIVVLVIAALGFIFFKGPSNNVTVTETNTPTPTPTTPAPTPTPSGLDLGINGGISTAPVKEFTISGKNFSFTPNTIAVNKGDHVKITFQNTAGFHNLVIDEYGVATAQKQAPDTETIEFIADKVGTFEYYCAVGTHRAMGMVGTLTVK
jgi:plastocyanin